MTFEAFTSLFVFAIVSSITPGPNNLMLMASGANFGILRTLPHMFGVALGFLLMLVLVGLGLARIFETYPAAYSALKLFSVGYLLFLAWKIATAAPKLDDPGRAGRPFSFLQAAGFQWVNPKAWSMALTAMTVYLAPGAGPWGVVLVALVFTLCNLPSIGVWAYMGTWVRRLLSDPRRLRAFNIAMALLLVASLGMILR